MKQVLALDFDGLLCDSLNECLLVVWNGQYGKSLAAFSDSGLAELPAAFVTRFQYCRNFARHLGHFLVPLLDSDSVIRSQQDFETIYQSLPEKDIRVFISRVSAYRERARQEKHAQWLRYHRLYPGIADFLLMRALPTYIVTARDTASVVAILGAEDVSFRPDHVFGEQTRKIRALEVIARRENVAPAKIHFYDDSLPNVIEARQAGYDAIWALWGYHAADHFALADKQHIRALSLLDFLCQDFACPA